MSTTKTLSFLEEMGWDRVEELAREASRKAIAEAHAHGLPVAVAVDGVPSLVYPDGRVEPLETSDLSGAQGIHSPASQTEGD
ncbi:MAG: hypothetical protein IJM64_05670 [Ottowia sp.]|nr:hypothetical protein [Ottowia sp.]